MVIYSQFTYEILLKHGDFPVRELSVYWSVSPSDNTRVGEELLLHHAQYLERGAFSDGFNGRKSMGTWEIFDPTFSSHVWLPKGT